MTIKRAQKRPIKLYFRTVEDCSAFAQFILELIESVKNKTLQEAQGKLDKK
jgi:hypothetical protein